MRPKVLQYRHDTCLKAKLWVLIEMLQWLLQGLASLAHPNDFQSLTPHINLDVLAIFPLLFLNRLLPLYFPPHKMGPWAELVLLLKNNLGRLRNSSPQNCPAQNYSVRPRVLRAPLVTKVRSFYPPNSFPLSLKFNL